jgi:hypothetical protein
MTFSGGAAPATFLSPLVGLLDIKELKVDVQGNHTILIQPTLSIPPIIAVEISILPFTAILSGDNGQSLVTISMDEIILSTDKGIQQISPSLRLYLDSSELGAKTMGDIVRKAVFGRPSYMSIGNVEFEGPSGTAGINRLFSLVRLRLPIHSLFFAMLMREAPDEVLVLFSNLIFLDGCTCPHARKACAYF